MTEAPLGGRAALDGHLADRSLGPLLLGNHGGWLTRDRVARALRQPAPPPPHTPAERPHPAATCWMTSHARRETVDTAGDSPVEQYRGYHDAVAAGAD